MEKTHYRSCNLCEAMCGLEITHDNGEVLSIKGDKNDPFSKGYICPKAVALQDIYTDKDRLRKPMKRHGENWREISWTEAFDDVAENLKAIQEEHGRDAVGIYQGNPNVHNLGTMLFGSGFTRALKTKNKFSATSADQLPHHFVSQEMLGHLLLLPVPDVDRTDFFLVFGANPVVSNGSIMSAAGMPKRLKDLKNRGGKLVVVDPRRTETAQVADMHLFINPATDVYLLAGFLHLLFKDNLTRGMKDYYKNYDAIQELFEPYDPALVEKLTGVQESSLRQLVSGFCEANTAVCYGRMGVSTQQHGSLCQYLIYLINMLTGNFDTPGGFMLPKPAVDVVRAMGSKGTKHKFGRWKSRVRGLPEFGGELPVASMNEEIMQPGEGQIKALITSSGNPVLSTPNGQALDQALSKLDYMVSIDIYINETTRHANIILPPATGLEVDHYDLVFNNLAVRNTAKFSERLFKPKEGAKEDWQIFKALTKRLKKRTLKEKVLEMFITPQRMLNFGLKRGPYQDLSLDKLKKSVHGLDLGPLEPMLPGRLFTDDKKVDLAPNSLVSSFKDLSKTPLELSKRLLLIGRRQLRSNNSWMHNSERLVKGRNRCTLLMNARDADGYGLIEGQEVEVKSRVGSVRLPIEITEDIKQGVVSIPHGWGHNRNSTSLQIAERHPGVSLNDLTDENLIDGLTGNAAFNGVPVEVTA